MTQGLDRGSHGASNERAGLVIQKAFCDETPKAKEKLSKLSQGPNPRMIKVGVKSRGCSGLVYNLEYVTEKGKLDEEVSQDGIKVLIDSKALLSVIGSEMDYREDDLSSQFVFNNPNVKETCGCGLSFRT